MPEFIIAPNEMEEFRAIDILMEENNERIIIEVKSTKEMDDIGSHIRQLNLYEYWIKKMFEGKVYKRIYYSYWNENQVSKFIEYFKLANIEVNFVFDSSYIDYYGK